MRAEITFECIFSLHTHFLFKVLVTRTCTLYQRANLYKYINFFLFFQSQTPESLHSHLATWNHQPARSAPPSASNHLYSRVFTSGNTLLICIINKHLLFHHLPVQVCVWVQSLGTVTQSVIRFLSDMLCLPLFQTFISANCIVCVYNILIMDGLKIINERSRFRHGTRAACIISPTRILDYLCVLRFCHLPPFPSPPCCLSVLPVGNLTCCWAGSASPCTSIPPM